MMTETNLKEILKTLFSIDDEHLVPITTNWFVPRIKPGTNEDTIGYRGNQNQSEKKGKKISQNKFQIIICWRTCGRTFSGSFIMAVWIVNGKSPQTSVFF